MGHFASSTGQVSGTFCLQHRTGKWDILPPAQDRKHFARPPAAVFLPPVARHPSCHHSLTVSVSVIQQLRILSFQGTLALFEGTRLMVQDKRILREKTVSGKYFKYVELTSGGTAFSLLAHH